MIAHSSDLVEAFRGPYSISSDPARLDLAAVHAFLSSRSYWAVGIPLEIVRRAAEHSLCFGLYCEREVGDAGAVREEQVGFARVITDRTLFAYLADVYVLEEHRRQGLGKWLIGTILEHPDLQGVRRFMLVTHDAQGLYARFGFQSPEGPSGIMQIRRVNAYGAAPDAASGASSG